MDRNATKRVRRILADAGYRTKGKQWSSLRNVAIEATREQTITDPDDAQLVREYSRSLAPPSRKRSEKPVPAIEQARHLLYELGMSEAHELDEQELREQSGKVLQGASYPERKKIRKLLGIDWQSEESQGNSIRAKAYEATFFFRQGYSIEQACEMVSMPIELYQDPMEEQSVPEYLPSPEEIEAATARIREEWDDEEYDRRRRVNVTNITESIIEEPMTVPVIKTSDLEHWG